MLRSLAAITSDFIQKVKRVQDAVAWTSPAFKGGRKTLTVHCLKDPADPQDPGYYYVERTGKDSVGFILWDDDQGLYGLLQQWHGPLKRFQIGSFTGSRDKDGLDALGTCLEEVTEEAGYHIDEPHRALHIGTYPVSANTNEEVDLFLIDVTGLSEQTIQPENVFEANTKTVWLDLGEINSKAEWKAIVIMLEHQRSLEDSAVEF